MSELTLDELCAYFEALPEGRQQLVWVRCRRLLGDDIESFFPSDPQLDVAFEQVLRDMWAQDTLTRLCELGYLTAAAGEDGRIAYRSV